MIRINVIHDIRHILRWETLNDDLESGAITGVIVAALLCVAMILFSP